MDEGKNSLGTAGATNADAFETPVQPPTHPANSTVSSDSTADDKIISSANLAPPTPLSAPLPTDPLHPIQTVGTGKGDVVVGGRPGASKKWLLGLGVVGVAVVFLALALMMGLSDKGGYRRARTDFLRYANFILHGTESAEELDDACVQENSCYFTQTLQNKDQFDAFFTNSAGVRAKLNEAVDVWSEKVATQDDKNESSATEIIQELKNLLELSEFIRIYSSRGILKKSDIVDYYLQNGEGGIQGYIDDYYDVEDRNNTYLDDLRENIAAMSTAALDNINLYAQYGCMDGFMNDACFTTNATQEDKEIVAENNQIIANYGSEMEAYANTPYNLINSIVEINNLFNSYQQTEQE